MAGSLLFVGAHCGDAEISGGAALARAVRQGGRASILHLTAGDKGHPTMPPAEYRKLRLREAEEAASELGLAEMRVLDCADAELLPAEDVVDEVVDFVRLTKPTTILTHWARSIHPDHEVTHRIALRAAFKAGIAWVERGLPAHWAAGMLFAENWEDRAGFVPHTYLDVTEDWETWRRAAERYALFRGEVVKFPYVSYYDALARVRGPEAGFERALAFALPEDRNRRVTREM